MMIRIATLALLFASAIVLYLTWDQYRAGDALAIAVEKKEAKLRELLAEEHLLRALPDKEILPKSKALSDLILNLRAESDLLGGTVRLSLPQTQIWAPVRYGIFKTSFSLDVTAPVSAAPALLTMVTERAFSRAVQITMASVRATGEVVGLKMNIVLYGRGS